MSLTASPLATQPYRRGHVAFKSAAATPELPLLEEAASELALLPAASVDSAYSAEHGEEHPLSSGEKGDGGEEKRESGLRVGSRSRICREGEACEKGEEEENEKACENEKTSCVWTPASTSIPASPRSSNRRSPSPSPSGEPGSAGSASPSPIPGSSEASQTEEGAFLEDCQEEGPFHGPGLPHFPGCSFHDSQLLFSGAPALPPTLPNPCAWPSSPGRSSSSWRPSSETRKAQALFKKEAQAIEIGSGVSLPACGYVPMWCWVQPGEMGTLVVPISDGEADQPPFVEGLEAEGTFMKLWCWAQPQGAAGQTTVVPCTDKGQTAPTNSAGATDAQKSPRKTDNAAKGAGYVPEWTSGPYWPFNASPTTLLIQNLSLELTQEDLLEVLDREEFSGLYDFVYLRPSENNTSEAILQEAIVNVTQHKYGLQMAARLHGRSFWGVSDDRSCKVTWSFVQGLDNLLQVYRDAPSSVKGGSPQLFRKGWPVPFP